MALRHKIGRLGEALAEHFLVERGFTVVERNVRIHGDELDLIMSHRSTLIAVEVKTTTNGADPFDAVDEEKMRRIRRAAGAYRLQISRIDVIAVTISSEGSTIHWVQSMV